VLGDFSLDSIINELQNCIKKQIKFEDTIYHILKNLKYDDETIASIFNLSETNTIDLYLKLIKDEL
jgi:hypothetical protein